MTKLRNIFAIFLLFNILIAINCLFPLPEDLPVFRQQCKPISDDSAIIRLKRYLFCDYENTLIPRKDTNKNATSVRIGLVIKYFDFSEWGGTLDLTSWLILIWQDRHLVWKPSDFDNIATLQVGTSEIWIPDITIYNPGTLTNSIISMPEVNCHLSSNGMISCIVPNTFQIQCKVDYTRYPYDQQNCTMNLRSLTYTTKDLVFKNRVKTASNSNNPKWKLLNSTARVDVVTRPIDYNQSHHELVYNFLFQRHSGTAEAVLVVPVLGLMFLTVLSVCWKATELERFFLIVCNIASHLVTLFYLPWSFPGSGAPSPIIVRFYRDSILLVLFVLIESIIVRWIEQKSSEMAPEMIKFINGIVFRSNNQLALKKVENKEFSNSISNETDETNLTAEPAPEEVPFEQKYVMENTEKMNDWICFGVVIDRFCIIILLIVYIVLASVYIP